MVHYGDTIYDTSNWDEGGLCWVNKQIHNFTKGSGQDFVDDFEDWVYKTDWTKINKVLKRFHFGDKSYASLANQLLIGETLVEVLVVLNYDIKHYRPKFLKEKHWRFFKYWCFL